MWKVEGFRGRWDRHKEHQEYQLGSEGEVSSRDEELSDGNDGSLEWRRVHCLG